MRRLWLFYGILIVFITIFCELLFRCFLSFLGFPFLLPKEGLIKLYYPEIREIRESRSAADSIDKHVLLLGGSVISSVWSRMDERIDTLLATTYNPHWRYKVYNAAVAGHSSRDNFLKYELLKNEKFDLVLYYEAINENRANNIPSKLFKEDYSHIQWYEDIEIIRRHPEMNWTVMPFVLDKFYTQLDHKLTKRQNLGVEEVKPEYMVYGDSIKTEKSYETNLEGIIDVALSKNEKLLLVNYSTYFPDNVELKGELSEMEYFTYCPFAAKITIWGLGKNIKKGVKVHNAVLEKLAKKHNQWYFPLQLPPRKEYFCDVCHVTELGAVEYANQIVNYISENKLLH